MKQNEVRIGDVLVNYGYLTQEQLTDALKLQLIDKNKRIGEVLLENGFITEEQFLFALSKRLDLPIIDFKNTPVDINAVSLVPKAVSKKNTIIVISTENQRATLVVNDPLDFYAIEDVKFLINMPCDIKLAKKKSIEQAINKSYAEIDTLQAATVANSSVDATSNEDVQVIEVEDAQSPVVNLLNSIIIKAYNDGASDVHIEPFEKYLLVRCRIDGLLVENMKLEISLNQHLSARIKILSGLDIAERRVPQDGHFKIKIKNMDINIRVSTMPTMYGETVVLRFLTQTTKLDYPDHYGMTDENYKKISRILKNPHGIIYITGPTGSGKTTTLYMIIEDMVARPINISTIEDPIEKNIEKVNQVQLNPLAGLTFESGLRAMLRQDPDVILVGETRDSETAKIAISAAVTGHLVFSTLHTNDAISTVVRLSDMGIEDYLIANSVVGVVAQRLIKKICPYCKEQYEASEAEQAMLPGIRTLYRGKGCHNCNYTGYKGRTAVHEILEIDSHIRSLVSKKQPTEMIYQYVKENDKLKFIKDSVNELVERGVTTVEELIKNSSFVV
ncbi:MAG: ATPase, T2SS/T4P/T4SS family [Eubacteriales bacterium]|nr:ATPase, T2SS/T4P/T4SS family [Eubacteriales bacterium]